MTAYIVTLRSPAHEHIVVLAGLPGDTTPREALDVLTAVLSPPGDLTTVDVADDTGRVLATYEYTPPAALKPLSDTLPAAAAALLRAMQTAPSGRVH